MNLRFWQELSLPRMAGIDKILVVDIRAEDVSFTLIKRNEPVYRINSSKLSHKNCEILAFKNEKFSGDFLKLNPFLRSFLQSNQIKEPRIIVGIKEYKYSMSMIPIETEDIDVWFLENTHKFLPEGSPKDEFSLYYEKEKEDDNYRYFSVVITRNDYLNSIVKYCTVEKGSILAVLPFPVAFNICGKEEPGIIFEFERNKISYFIENPVGTNFADSHFINQGECNPQNINEYLSGVRDTLQSHNINIDSLTVMANYNDSEMPWLGDLIKSVFKSKQINKDFEKESYCFITPFLAAQKIISNFETKLNLVNTESFLPQREIVEKQLTMRLILSLSAVFIILLFAPILFENYITDKIDNQDIALSDINQRISQVEILQKENARLKKNMSNLGSLKNNRVRHSKLLYDLSKIVTRRTSFIGLNLKDIESGQILVEISGTAINQQDVAKVISLMEAVKSFKEVALLNSSLSDDQGNTNKNKIIQFNISAKYNAD